MRGLHIYRRTNLEHLMVRNGRVLDLVKGQLSEPLNIRVEGTERSLAREYQSGPRRYRFSMQSASPPKRVLAVTGNSLPIAGI